jgi:Ca2+-binding RTX toxin-like protein
MAATEKLLAELYVAVLGRAPDAEGLAFWLEEMQAGASLLDIGANWFRSQAEVNQRYEGLDIDGFIAQAYQNVFRRAPDPVGLAFWRVPLVEGVISRENFINALIDGAKAPTGGAADVAILNHRAEIGLQFSRLELAASDLYVDVIKLGTAEPSSVILAQAVFRLIALADASEQSAVAMTSISTLIDNLAGAIWGNPNLVSGLTNYLSGVADGLEESAIADAGKVIGCAANVVREAEKSPSLLNNSEDLAQDTVSNPGDLHGVLPADSSCGSPLSLEVVEMGESVELSGIATGPITITLNAQDEAVFSRGSVVAPTIVQSISTKSFTVPQGGHINVLIEPDDGANGFTINAPNAASIDVIGSGGSGTDSVNLVIESASANPDLRTMRLSTAGLKDVEVIKFIFPEDARDVVVLAADSVLTGFTTIEISKGGVDFTAVSIQPGIQFVVNSTLTVTLEQFKSMDSLVSVTGLGKLIINLSDIEVASGALQAFLRDPTATKPILIGADVTVKSVSGETLQNPSELTDISHLSIPGLQAAIGVLQAQLDDLEIADIADLSTSLSDLNTAIEALQDVDLASANRLTTLRADLAALESAIGEWPTYVNGVRTANTGSGALVTVADKIEADVAALRLAIEGNNFTAGDYGTLVEIQDALEGLEGLAGSSGSVAGLNTLVNILINQIVAGPGVELSVAQASNLAAEPLGTSLIANYQVVDSGANILSATPLAVLENAKRVSIDGGIDLSLLIDVSNPSLDTLAEVAAEFEGRGVDWTTSSFNLTGSAASLLSLPTYVLNNATNVQANGVVYFDQANSLLRLQNLGTMTIGNLSMTVDQANRITFDTNDFVNIVTILDDYSESELNLSSFPLRASSPGADLELVFSGQARGGAVYLPVGLTGDGYNGQLDAEMYYVKVKLSDGPSDDEIVFNGGGDIGDTITTIDGSFIKFSSGDNTLTLIGGVDLSAARIESSVIRFAEVKPSLSAGDTISFAYGDSEYLATLTGDTLSSVQSAIDTATRQSGLGSNPLGSGKIVASFEAGAGTNLLLSVTDPSSSFRTAGLFTDLDGSPITETFGFGNFNVVARAGPSSLVSISGQAASLMSGLTGDGSTTLEVVNPDGHSVRNYADNIIIDLSSRNLTGITHLRVSDGATVRISAEQAASLVDVQIFGGNQTGLLDIEGKVAVAVALKFSAPLADGFELEDAVGAVEAVTDPGDLAILGKASLFSANPSQVIELRAPQAAALEDVIIAPPGYDIRDTAENLVLLGSDVLDGASHLVVEASSACAADLNLLDRTTSTLVDASLVDALTGSTADLAIALSSTGIDTANDIGVTVDAGIAAAADLNTIVANTTAVVNALQLNALTGSAADIAIAVNSSQVNLVSNLGVTVTAAVAAATDLNTIDTKTTEIVDASLVTSLTGFLDEVKTALQSISIIGLDAVDVTLADARLSAAGLYDLVAATSGDIHVGPLGLADARDLYAILVANSMFGRVSYDLTESGDAIVAASSSTRAVNALQGAGSAIVTADVATLRLDLSAYNGTREVDFIVIGNAHSNELIGGSGDDVIGGGAGDDTITGGAGADVLSGGDGDDLFVLNVGDSGLTLSLADVITDFRTGADTIQAEGVQLDIFPVAILDGSLYADLDSFFSDVRDNFSGTKDIVVAYNASLSGDAWVYLDQNSNGLIDSGDGLLLLTGISLISDIASRDFIG